MRRIMVGCLVALLLVGFMIGCKPATGVDTTAPTVSSTVPVNGATGVAVNATVTATFDEAMDATTITADTFLVTGPGTTAVAGAVTLDSGGTTATFTPTSALTGSTTYTATITIGAKDAAGNALGSAVVWSFASIDTTPPTVSSTVPVDLGSLATNRDITATFNEPMDSSTITAATFTVTVTAGAAVSGTVTYVGTTAVFNPASNLTPSTGYTATITTGAKDAAGNALASAKVWTFTSGAGAAAGPAPVVLGTSGSFVILSKSGISTDPASTVTGNMGVSPAAATYLTGFSLIADSTNVFSTSGQVTGQIFAADYADPTPSNLTTAVSNMETAYTDAAGRAADYTELYSGDLSGQNLTPGVYKWGTGVLITATNVTLTATDANDVWIFQIAGGLTVGSGAQVILAGGAQSKNIFWQVADVVDIGTTAQFKGVVLAQTKIAMKTGATINGRLLAQTAVTLQANAVTQP